MTPGRGGVGGAERLEATFAGDAAHLFLQENGQRWTVGRLLAYAADIERAIPADAGSLVAVRSHTAAFVVASLLALWKCGRSPLLIDPALTSEPSGLRTRGERVPVLAPAEVADPWSDAVVAESAGAPISPRFPAAGACEVAFFTSGSTGEPKIVRKKAHQLAEQYEIEAPWLGLTGAVSVLCFVPAFHILGYIYGFYLPAAGGGTVVFNRDLAPQQWIDQIRERGPRLVVAVPPHYRLMSRVLTGPLPAATYLSSGGPVDPVVSDEFQRRAGSPILQVLGSTETGGIANRVGLGPWRPFPSLSWRGREDDGRLLIKSAWQDHPDEWRVTGDAVAAEGETFRLLGRADSVVKVGGRRFSTGEVVQAALGDPRIEQAHAVVYGRFGELAVALFVVPGPGAFPTTADVRSRLAGLLAPFKVPRTIQVLSALPTRGIGKVDEEALRQLVSPEARGSTPS
ncbi:MAG TPA: AMP-binding protein [Vicinamibacterales bacterium]